MNAFVIIAFFGFSVFAKMEIKVQKEIVEDIQVENEVGDSYKNLPSVGSLTNDESQMREMVAECLKNKQAQWKTYEETNLKNYIENKFTTGSGCEKVNAEIEEAHNTLLEVAAISNEDRCKIEEVDINLLTKKKAKANSFFIQQKLGNLMADYTKYFTYSEEISLIERCIEFYSNFTIIETIDGEMSEILQEVEKFRPLIEQHGFKSFYGENLGVSGIGLKPIIEDLKNHIITPWKARGYAVLELNPQNWQCTDFTDDFIEYSFNEHSFLMPMESGKSYSCNELPNNLFVLQKKIENPKNQYSIIIFKPLE